MRGKFGCRLHGIVCNDFVAFAVVADADYGAVLHRETGEITHPAVGALAEEPATPEVRKFLGHRHLRSYGR